MTRIRPLYAALLLGLIAELLFLFHLTRPSKLVFDEVHYVPAARSLLALTGPVNIEHPLLAKEFIAFGIAIFGDNALGWRFFSTLAGSAVVIGLFAILWLTFGRMRPAILGSVLAILNFTLFIQARIAMLDGFMAAFVVVAIAAMLWAMRAPADRVVGRLVLTAVLLGLAVACKWTAAPYVAFAGIAFALFRGPKRWPRVSLLKGWAIHGGVSIAVYFLTFLPAFFYANEPLTLGRLIPFQFEMLAQQTQKLPPHIYQSDWWSWPLMLRPIWYLYEPVDGAFRGILLVGNPMVFWGGLFALAACLWAGWRERSARLAGVAALWLGSYLIWAIIPKSLGFFYYYYLSSLFLPLALAAAFDRFGKSHWDEWFTIAAFCMFLYFYPILSAAALANGDAFHHWAWFAGWV